MHTTYKTYIRTYIHTTYMHTTYIHAGCAYLHAYIHIYMHACMHAYIHTDIHMYTYIHTCIHSCNKAHSHHSLFACYSQLPGRFSLAMLWLQLDVACTCTCTQPEPHDFQVVFYGFHSQEKALQGLLDGKSDVVMIASWTFQTFIDFHRFEASQFSYLGPQGSTPSSDGPASDFVYGEVVHSDGIFLSSASCE